MTRGRSRARSIVLALAVGVVAAIVLARVGSDERRAGEPPIVGTPPAPSATRLESASAIPAAPAATAADVAHRSSTSPAVQPVQASPQTRATPPSFDLARLPPKWRQSLQAADPERFPTTKWFTKEDQRHPERYFELAARMPELNRREERRKTLEYFVAYRAKLDRDLAAAGDGPDREELLATRARYDDAITRLRGIIGAEGAPSPR